MKRMKKIVSAFLAVTMLISLSVGLSATCFAAGAEITATAQEVYTKSEIEQDITIRIAVSDLSEAYCGFAIEGGTTLPEGWAFKSISTSYEQAITDSDYNTANGKVTYYTSDVKDTIPGSTYYDVVVTAPGNAVGTYDIVFENVILWRDMAQVVSVQADMVTATVTISEPSATGYTVTMSADQTSVNTNADVTISLDVTNSSANTFNAVNLTLTYDASKFTFDSAASTLNGFTATAANGTLTITDFGATVTMINGAEFVLKFNAGATAASGCNFALTSAQVGAANDANADIADAAVTGTPVSVDITAPVTKYTVTFVGGVDATGTAPTTNEYTAGATFTLPANTFTKDGYTFAGWSDGTTTYKAGATYTMPTNNVTFTAQWTKNAPTLSVTTDLSYLDGYTLIKVTIADADGNVPTCDGNAMYQVANVSGADTYDATAYYYVVKGEDYNADKIAYATASAGSITKTGDANQTGKIDINDAQFIYNLYNSNTITVTYVPTVIQLLASDVNGDGVINVNDCTAAVSAIE